VRKLFELINKNLFFESVFERMKKPPVKKQLPLITLSREKGSGGRPVASLVAKKLGRPWKVYHKEILDELAKNTHLERQLVKQIDESHLPLTGQIIADFFGKRYLNLTSYYKNLVKILSTIGQRGHAIIVGRGANFLFPKALKVRLICEMPQRILWMRKFENLTEKEAILRLEKSDKERGDFVRTVFNHDPRKAHHYDLVIRTGPHLSIEDAADLIVRMAKRRFKI
jgi:cytidylate kinase